MAFSFNQVPVKAKRRPAPKKRVVKPTVKPTKAGLLRLLAMVIDPTLDIEDVERQRIAMRKAKECLVIIQHFSEPSTKTVIMRRGNRVVFVRKTVV